MESLSEMTGAANQSKLTFQLQDKWENISTEEKNTCIEKATEGCKLICNVIAPSDGETLFAALSTKDQSISEDLQALINAFTNAPSRNLKTQILSIYAYQYSIATLQKLHEPFIKISKWQIKRARAHARANGPGMVVIKPTYHRVSLDMFKVDHFIDFVNRPYFHQDVAYGVRSLRLDSGARIEMPNVIRTVTRSTMIAQYFQFCKEESFDPLSRSTLYRILEVREASQRKSFQGLDNTAADGSTGFQTLHNITEQLLQVGVDKTWAQTTIRRLDKGKQYLKTNFKVNCNQKESCCADHCRPFALSDPNDKDFQVNCQHEHNMICHDCEELKNTINDMERKLLEHTNPSFSEEHRGDLVHDFKEAKNNIRKWKSHILRSVNQEEAKQKVLQDLDNGSVLIVMDWAMKFVQTRFREKQSEWYGKRGLSWHISSVVSKDTEKNTLNVTSYAHLFDQCTQDWFSVVSLVENLLSTVKANSPNVTKAYFRSDEAGCYHSNQLLAAIKDVGNRVGVAVARYDFSEPQQGKDICDRIICPLKSSVRAYCNEGHDILTAKDMNTALEKHPVKGATSSVNEVNQNVENLEVKKIPNISSFHNFSYTEDGVQIWKAYGIGDGKILKESSIYVNHQQDTQMRIISDFSQIRTERQSLTKRKPSEDDAEEVNDEGLFECPEPGCNYVFYKFNDLELHQDFGQHSRIVGNETVYDTIRREWASKYRTVSNSLAMPTVSETLEIGQSEVQMGWALAKPRTGSVRFPEKVRNYLIAKFNVGEKTGLKSDPDHVQGEMRHARDHSGERLFVRDEWLTATQIKGFFSRLAKIRREKGNQLSHEQQQLLEFVDLDTDESEEDAVAENSNRTELREQIEKEIDVQHPICFDIYDLCDLYKQRKLSQFKVKMLKEMCSYFEINLKSREKKDDLLHKISNMVEKCSCSKT